MARYWNNIPLDIPNDNQIVWVRLYNSACPPFQAIYHADTQTFESVKTHIIYPIYTIYKWRETW